MAFFSTISALGGLLAGASAAGAAVLGGLTSAAATAASAVAGGTLSAASAIASGAINAGQLVMGEIISAPDLLMSVAAEGGNLVATGSELITSGAGSLGEITSTVMNAGGDAAGMLKDVVAKGIAAAALPAQEGVAMVGDVAIELSPELKELAAGIGKGLSITSQEAVKALAQAGGDAAALGKDFISSGSMGVKEVASAIQQGGGSAARFLGDQIQSGALSAKDAMSYAKDAGLDAGSFASGLVQSGLTSAQDLLTGSEDSSWYETAKSALPSLETVGNVASQIVSAPIDAAGALLNAAPGVAGAAQNVAAGGGGGLGTDLLNIGSTLLQGQQAKKAAETQAAGTNRALDILEKSMATTRSDLLKAGETGRADIMGGAAGAESALAPFTKTNYLNMANKYLMNPTAALSDPGAAWELEQGRKGLESAATVKSGGGLSGQQMKEASQYAINFASTKTDEALARLAPFLEMQYGASTNIANIRSGAGTSKANLGIGAAGGAAEATASGSQNIASTLKELGNIESQKDISKGITIGNISEYLR